MPESTHDRMARIFRELMMLIREGQFTKEEVRFMLGFTESAYRATQKLAVRVGALKEETGPKESGDG